MQLSPGWVFGTLVMPRVKRRDVFTRVPFGRACPKKNPEPDAPLVPVTSSAGGGESALETANAVVSVASHRLLQRLAHSYLQVIF